VQLSRIDEIGQQIRQRTRYLVARAEVYRLLLD
jgi:hypothetical protein